MSPTPAPALAEAADCQSRAVREVGVACCAYLLMVSGAVLLWLRQAGAPLDAWAWGMCALGPAAGLALLWRDTADARQYMLHMITAALGFPVLLLFWAASVDGQVTTAAPPDRPSLEARQLFEGAAAVEDADMRGGGITLLRSGRFADGSELRLTRFADAGAAGRYLAMLAQAMPTAAFTDGGRQGVRLLGAGVGSTLVVVEQHGPDLLELRAADRDSGLARLAAQQVPVPLPMPVAGPVSAPAKPAARWPFFTAMAIAHGLTFVALIAWAGSHTTRLPASLGATAATPDQLRARLLSLARPTGPFDITELAAEGSQALRIDASPGRRRSHHITLHIDTRRGCVRVHEKLGINGDAPHDADEASMRSPGDDWFDPTRPDARKVWSSSVQATMIVPSRLAAVPLQLHPRHAELPANYAATLDGEGVLTALCALVTRSGWQWQPRMFGTRI